jgi:hypothetical protein
MNMTPLSLDRRVDIKGKCSTEARVRGDSVKSDPVVPVIM